MSVDSTGPAGVADLEPLARREEQRAWYFYDWANSAYVTTVYTVMFTPFLVSVAKIAACGVEGEPGNLWRTVDGDSVCEETLSVLGLLNVSPGSLPFYLVTFSTILSALILPIMGAIADRTEHKKQLLAGFAWTGAAAASLIFFVTEGNWQLGALAFVVANLALGASVVVNDSILPLISTEEERDRVSSRGWAFGYLGGGLLLVVNLGTVLMADRLDISTEFASRISMLSAAIWWAGFTLVPFLRLRNYKPYHIAPEKGSLLQQSFGQLMVTLRDMRNYPVTITFLLAYLFFNDGIQTVIYAASIFVTEELGFEQDTLVAVVLMLQFVGVAGALVFGKAAERVGARRMILFGLVLWMAIVTTAYFLPEEKLVPVLVLAAGIGLVLGGTQALARSFFSLLIPRGKEGEYFSFYHAMERGTSWFGTLTFGIVHQLTGSYRPAILALMGFFVIGGILLLKVDTRRGILEAGNVPPSVV